MRIVVVGNHTCGNRGDGAILRGLLASLTALNPGITTDVLSRYAVSSSYLLGRPLDADRLHAFRASSARRGPRALRNARTTELLVASLTRPWLQQLLPSQVRAEIARLRTYDAVIQVGGSFFVDLYGAAQYDYALVAFLADVPLLLMGHSLGPFESPRSRKLAALLLARAAFVGLREPVSLALLEKAGLRAQNLHMGSDTAWLVPSDLPASSPSAAPLGPRAVERASHELSGARPCVAFTLRELAPFDRRLGVTQGAYERAMAELANLLVDRGYDVLLASTCTGIESYHRDDRVVALRLRAQTRDKDRVHVVMDELNDLELGQLFARCALVVGTRLHSAIIAMNFGTPAVALNYEHKSQGIMEQLGLPEMSFALSALLDGSVGRAVLRLLDEGPALRERVALAVARERARAHAMVEAGLARVTADAAVGAGVSRPSSL